MSYELVLAKEDFKFSVAHFTIFGPTRAETLHGHNYVVRVRVAGERTDELGLLIDLEELKKEVRGICHRLDGKTLVPSECSLLRVESDEEKVELQFGDRQYRVPARDTVLLPVANTSIEELALYIWKSLAPGIDDGRAGELTVEVEETPGQSCIYRASLKNRLAVASATGAGGAGGA